MSMISELVNELRKRADVEGRGTINEHLMTKAADTIEMLSEKVREPKTEVEIARAIVHKMIDNSELAEDAYPDLRQRLHEAIDEYEPQERSE